MKYQVFQRFENLEDYNRSVPLREPVLIAIIDAPSGFTAIDKVASEIEVPPCLLKAEKE